MSVDVIDGEVKPPLAGVAAVQILGTLGRDQDHPITVRDRGILDRLVRLAVEHERFDAKGIREPAQRGANVVVGEAWVDIHEQRAP